MARATRIQPIETPMRRTQATVRAGSLTNSSRPLGAASEIGVSIVNTVVPLLPRYRSMDVSVRSKQYSLRAYLSNLGSAVVAYSGGVDSAYLAFESHHALGRGSLAVTAVSPSLARRELRAARALATRIGLNHRIVGTRELGREEYARNGSDRCYWCKTELLEVLAPIAEEAGAQVLVGTNLDDLGDFRPGLRAATEKGAVAPLADAGLTKADIRLLSAELGLPTADKPASPCLSSRVAYGVRVTPQRLRRVERAEDFLISLGFEELRVRDHGDLARIEVPAGDVERVAALGADIATAFQELGFQHVTVDLAGFRSGSMNTALGMPTFRLGAGES
jgi:pyridinium-3,5-biscarboxylic acid mononucleotide sulfurtransferase